MQIRRALPVLLIAVLAACGSGGAATTAPGSTAAAQTTAAQPSAAQASSAPAGNGKVDCTAIKTAAQSLLMVQLLAQLKTPDTVESVKNKQIGNLDLDVFLSSMQQLHALDGYAGPLGDPKAAITFYETAGKAAKTLFATEPVTQAAIDTYNQNVGSIADFLGHQVAIGGAMDAAGC